MKYRILATALLAASAAAHADSPYGITASFGTTGLGLHVSRALRPDLNARLGLNVLELSHDVSTRDVDYDLSLRLRSVDALLDWFPAGSKFRLTGGLVYNANAFDGSGRPGAGGAYTLNGNTYPAATVGALRAEVDFRRIAPYLGIGWGNALGIKRGWGFAADLGVLFQGTPRSSLVNSGCGGPAALCARIASDVAAENRRLQDKLDGFRYYPVVRIGATYRF